MKAYLSGPMSGIENHNFPLFHKETAYLRSLGVDVVNPAELNPDPGKSWADCLRVDIKALCDCDAIVMLEGWAHSKGALLEKHIAEQLGLSVFQISQFYRDGGYPHLRAGR